MELKTKYFIDKFIYFSLVIVCLSICLNPLYKGLAITLLLISILTSYLSKKNNYNFNICNYNLLLIGLYFLYIIGIFYSYDKKEALFDLEVKLPLILLPLIFIFIPKKFITRQKLWYYFIAVIIGFVTYVFYAFGMGISKAITNSLPIIPEISYVNLAGQPSYFALIGAISSILIYKVPLIELFKLKVKLNYLIKGATLLIIMIFFLFLNSTSGLFLISFAFIYIILDLYLFEKKKILTLYPLILITAFYTLAFNFDSFNNRYEYYANTELKTEKKTGSQRKFINLNAHKILIQSSLFGVGTGDVKSTLNKFYLDNGANFSKYFNAHNQYLQTNIALGFIGLCLLFIVFLFPIIKMLREKEFFLLTIFILIGFSFLFESMLEKNMGTYFFALIYVLSNSYLYKED